MENKRYKVTAVHRTDVLYPFRDQVIGTEFNTAGLLDFTHWESVEQLEEVGCPHPDEDVGTYACLSLLPLLTLRNPANPEEESPVNVFSSVELEEIPLEG